MIKETTGDFLQRLRGFYYVAEKGSITDATVMMGRVQPTITHQIKSSGKGTRGRSFRSILTQNGADTSRKNPPGEGYFTL